VGGAPVVARPPEAVWINRPTQQLALGSGEDGTSSPQMPQNPPTERSPSPAGPPARASVAREEGVDGMDAATGRVVREAVAQMF